MKDKNHQPIKADDRVSYRLSDSTRDSFGRVVEVGYDGRIGAVNERNGYLDLLWCDDVTVVN